MSLVKKITVFSIFIAAVFGVLAKLNQKRKLAKQAAKRNILSVVFKFLGNTFNYISCKMKCNSNRSCKKAFMQG